MVIPVNGSQPRSTIPFSLVIAAVGANMQGLISVWNRTEARNLVLYLTIAAHFLLVVQYAVRFIGVGLRYRVDHTILGWASSAFVALISYIAANSVAAPEWWIGLYAVLTLGAVFKDWELRNWAKRNTEAVGGPAKAALIRRFEETAFVELLLSAFFFVLFMIVNTTLGTDLGLDNGTAVILVSAFALIITAVSLGVTVYRVRDLSSSGEAGSDRKEASTSSMSTESQGGE